VRVCVCVSETVSLTAVQLFFQRVEIFLQRNLHPYESGAGHDAGGEDDEQKQGVAHVAALRVASSEKRSSVVTW